MSEPNASPSLSRKEYSVVYECLRDEIHLRIGLQNKCVELSIHITTALAAAVVGIVVAASKEVEVSSALMWLLAFYGLVQSLTFTNYIYHTFFILRLHAYLRDRMRPLLNERAGLPLGDYEQGSLPQDVRAFKSWTGRLLFHLQPFPIVGSIGLAWLVLSVMIASRPVPSTLSPWQAWGIVTLLWSELWGLWRLHREAHEQALTPAIGEQRKTLIP